MPTVRILKPADQPALEAFLLPRIARSMFLLSNARAAGLADGGQAYQGTYAGLFAEAALTGVVAHYWNQMLIPQAPEGLDELWRAAVRASGRAIGGAIGPSDQVQAMVEAWHAAGWMVDVQLDQQEKLYTLSLDALCVPEGLRTGRLRGRRMAAHDLDRVTRWRMAFVVESLHEEEGPLLRQTTRAAVARSLQSGHTWLLEERQPQPEKGAPDAYRPVATSSFNAALREAVQIGGVYTPPELRCRGYGRAAVAASLLDARAEGVETAILFTGEDNLPAQKAYAALGFRHVGSYRLLILSTPIVEF